MDPGVLQALQIDDREREPVVKLDVRDVHTYYGDSHVIQGASLEVGPGEAVALLGRNGAGKTTLMRSIVGLTPPRSGSILVDGHEIRGAPVFRSARLGLAFLPSGRRVFSSLSVAENLEVARRSCPRRGGPWNVARVYEAFPKLAEVRNRRSGYLSGGEQQMLKIGRALVTNPEMILLDEPTEGLAPLVVEQLGKWLELLSSEKLSILLAEQSAAFALAHTTRGYLLEKGRVRFDGTMEEIWDSAELRTALGVAEEQDQSSR